MELKKSIKKIKIEKQVGVGEIRGLR